MLTNKPFIVAEMSANHGGSFYTAVALVEAAAEAGADAIKLQTWQTMVYDEDYVIPSGAWVGQNLAKLYDKAKTPWEWHEPIFKRAKELGIIAFSTPFDYESLEFLESLDCPMYKVSSFEITDIPLIKAISKTGKPMMISTGMATDSEIIDAYAATDYTATLLRCTSAYPAESIGLIDSLAEIVAFTEVEWGISDHTEGIGIAIAATALGASVIEKHLTLSKDTLDGKFSLLPHEFKQMITECRRVAKTLESTDKPIEETSLRRSLYIAKDLSVGDILNTDNLRTARPALGLHPNMIDDLLGKPVTQDLKLGTPMRMEYVCSRR